MSVSGVRRTTILRVNAAFAEVEDDQIVENADFRE